MISTLFVLEDTVEYCKAVDPNAVKLFLKWSNFSVNSLLPLNIFYFK